jgi:hypothetical protein
VSGGYFAWRTCSGAASAQIGPGDLAQEEVIDHHFSGPIRGVAVDATVGKKLSLAFAHGGFTAGNGDGDRLDLIGFVQALAAEEIDAKQGQDQQASHSTQGPPNPFENSFHQVPPNLYLARNYPGQTYKVFEGVFESPYRSIRSWIFI